tara:strand:+ start:7269 stop:7961 length:693 start_codon:yes stop_codon:yes gene_type:complete
MRLYNRLVIAFLCIFIISLLLNLAHNTSSNNKYEFPYKVESIKRKNHDFYWVGQIHPDIDGIASVIAAAHLYGGTPSRAGTTDAEVEFVLDYFDVEMPQLVENFHDALIGLVDVNQTTQIHQTIEPSSVKAIIDHHALGKNPVHTPDAVFIEVRPRTSTAVIIAEQFILADKTIPKPIAGLLVSAILSTTDLLKSPMLTDKERRIADILAPIAGIKDLEVYGAKMQEAVQ